MIIELPLVEHIPGETSPLASLYSNPFKLSWSGGSANSENKSKIANFALISFDENDVDRDGSVDGSDLARFANAFVAGHPEADLSRDGFVNASDVAIFAEQFGSNTCRVGI